MKPIFIYAGLFLVFVTFLGAVRFLDSYSASYQSCALKWQKSAKNAKTSPALAAHLIQNLQDNKMSVNGAACPKLRPHHKDIIQDQLSASLKPRLRGLQNP